MTKVTKVPCPLCGGEALFSEALLGWHVWTTHLEHSLVDKVCWCGEEYSWKRPEMFLAHLDAEGGVATHFLQHHLGTY